MLLLFHISLLKRFIYRRTNTSKILHGATIPYQESGQDNICSFHPEKITFLSSLLPLLLA